MSFRLFLFLRMTDDLVRELLSIVRTMKTYPFDLIGSITKDLYICICHVCHPLRPLHSLPPLIPPSPLMSIRYTDIRWTGSLREVLAA